MPVAHLRDIGLYRGQHLSPLLPVMLGCTATSAQKPAVAVFMQLRGRATSRTGSARHSHALPEAQSPRLATGAAQTAAAGHISLSAAPACAWPALKAAG